MSSSVSFVSAKNNGAYSVETKSAKTFHFGNSGLSGFAIVGADRGHAGDRGHIGDFGNINDGVSEGGQAHNGQFPGLLEHVEACDCCKEYSKTQGEDGKGGQQFADDVE